MSDLLEPLRPIVGVTNAHKRLITGEREANDWYRTPPSVTKAILAVEEFDPLIWDPCVGDGAMADVLFDGGYAVIGTDLIDRGWGGGRDFLMERELLAPSICMNPPFKISNEFVTHALDLGASKVAVLQRLAFLEGMERHATIYRDRPPARVWVFSGRHTLWRGDDPAPKDKGGVMALAWFVWTRGFSGPPALGWLT